MPGLFKKLLFTSAMIAVSGAVAYGVPAKPGLLKMTQPDGTELNVQLMGDERHHFYMSEDGYMLVEDKGGFYYADVDDAGTTVNSRILAAPVGSRTSAAEAFLSTVDMPRVLSVLENKAVEMRRASAQQAPSPAYIGTVNIDKGLFPDANFPVHGQQKGLVILVQYTDVQFTLTDPLDYFSRMLNQEGFSDYNATGSAKDFFTLCSMGAFVPEFDVYGPVTLPQNQAYYGGNDWSGNDKNPEQMVVHACNILDDDIDFSEYDRDGDGVVDNVFIFYAGRGEASGGAANTVWPHSWNVTSGDPVPHYYDGVLVDRYACSNEWEGSRPDGVGTFVHEFSHVMGLPDLYATSYTGAFTPGSWSAMDYGPYNNNGCTPPLYGAFERYALGWMDPREISDALTATLRPIVENVAGVIRTPYDNEFFLLENRQKEGWDKYVPGHGMLIWHVQYVPSVWSRNVVNNTTTHQYVDIEEADNTRTESSRAGDAFPGTAGVTSFTADTAPAMRTWANDAIDLPITDIAETSDGNITFNVLGGKAGNISLPEVLSASEVTYHSFTANWVKEPDTEYYLTVYDAASDAPLAGLSRVSVGQVSSYAVDGLEAETTYYYALQAGDGWQFSDFSDKMSLTTLPLPLNLKAVTALPASDVTEQSFTASWLPLEEANGYMLTVFTMPMIGSFHDYCDFTDSKLPAGWKATSSSYYSNSAYSGEAIPALRLESTGSRLSSPVYDGAVRGLHFWHRASKADDATTVVISAYVGGQWKDIHNIPVTTEKGGKVLDITDFPVGTWAVAITFNRGGVGGALAVDDIVVDYGIASEKVPLDSYGDKPLGDVMSYNVTGLEPGTLYYYTVKATDGELVSLESDPIEVGTLASTVAIEGIVASGCSVDVLGRTITVSGVAAGAGISLMSPTGMVLAAGRTNSAGTIRFDAPAQGVYLVVVDGNAYKILIK